MELVVRKQGEEFLEWKYRVLKLKLDKLIDLDWAEIADLLGLEVSADHLRKTAYGIVEAMEYYQSKTPTSNEVLMEIEEKQRELFKERVKLQDARREHRKLDRVEARMEVLMEEMLLHAKNLQPLFKEELVQPKQNVDCREGLALFSDWHYGANINNHLNRYNREIAKERIKQLTEEIITLGKEQGISVLHVAQLGDIVNGQIHISTRVNNEVEVVRQIMEVTEILAESLAQFCYHFKEVRYYNVIGNHGRTINKKEDAHVKDNFEYFIVWWLKERLRDFNNISYIEDKDGVIITDILGSKVALSHGNFEKIGTPQALNDAYGMIINYICIGHFHHTQWKEVSKFTEMIINNSLCGTDEYALTIRKTSKTAQKFLIFDTKGLKTIHNIRFE